MVNHFKLTLIKIPGSMTIQTVEEDAQQVRGAGNHIIGGHKPERDNGQDDTRITCGGWGNSTEIKIILLVSIY